MFKQLRKKRNPKGFTLVELLVVIAIIGILAAIAIPQFAQYRARGYMAATISDTKNAYTAVEAWRADHPGANPPAETIGPLATGTTYTSARTSQGVTVAIAAGGNCVGTHAQLGGTYTIASNGQITPALTIP